MGSLFIAYLLIQYTSVSVYLFVLVVSLISLVYGILYKEFKGLFYLGLFGTIISILALISNIGNLPIVLYFVIIGIILIVTISVFIYKYQKYLVDGRYKRCINCDGKQDVDNKYCEYCGFPFVSKNNYCGECGSKILGDENYCRNCGNKLK
jgi:predicted membrane protein